MQHGDAPNRRMLDDLGGEAGCRRLTQEFYARVAYDAELEPLFTGKSLRCATEEFTAFLIQFLDGAPNQTQYRWWLSLRESHARFQTSDRQTDAWLSLMRETRDGLVMDSVSRRAMARFFLVSSGHIVGRSEGVIEFWELEECWHRPFSSNTWRTISTKKRSPLPACSHRGRPCERAGVEDGAGSRSVPTTNLNYC